MPFIQSNCSGYLDMLFNGDLFVATGIYYPKVLRCGFSSLLLAHQGSLVRFTCSFTLLWVLMLIPDMLGWSFSYHLCCLKYLNEHSM